MTECCSTQVRSFVSHKYSTRLDMFFGKNTLAYCFALQLTIQKSFIKSWKEARLTKTDKSSLFSNKVSIQQTFFLSNKLECLSLASFFQPSRMFESWAEAYPRGASTTLAYLHRASEMKKKIYNIDPWTFTEAYTK